MRILICLPNGYKTHDFHLAGMKEDGETILLHLQEIMNLCVNLILKAFCSITKVFLTRRHSNG